MVSIAVPATRAAVTTPHDVFSPLQLPGLKLWLDASRITGLADGDPIPSWADLSGLGNHATQGTVSKQPLYKVNIVNGRPVVRDDGVDDILETAAVFSLAQTTIFAVAKFGSSGTDQSLTDGIASGNRHVLAYNLATGQVAQYAGTTSVFSPVYTEGPFDIFESVFAGAASFTLKNGAAFIAGDPGSHTLTGLALFNRFSAGGVSRPLNGDIAEVVLCSGVVTLSDRVKTRRYLGAKYGIATS